MAIVTLAGIALSTLISEDIASIGAGLLARDGYIALFPAVAACVIGVYAGDLGLYYAGRVLGARALPLLRVRRRQDSKALAATIERVDAHLGTAILASRFVPGSRLPMYVAAGIWSRRPGAFAAWSLVAVTIWTPLLVV